MVPKTRDDTFRWLHGIVRNCAREHVRGEHRFRAAGAIGDEPADDSQSPFGVFEQSREHEAVSDCLNTLIDDEREVIRLKYFELMKLNEIAMEMEKSVSAVYKIHARAKAKLKSCLEGKGVNNA